MEGCAPAGFLKLSEQRPAEELGEVGIGNEERIAGGGGLTPLGELLCEVGEGPGLDEDLIGSRPKLHADGVGRLSFPI